MKRRLIDLGVTTGAQITMLRPAPLGDPVEFYILGYNLSLRRSEARNILIEKVGDTND
jgi:Fe2+ transport system protein FeoA